jgi:hypothetical protein
MNIPLSNISFSVISETLWQNLKTINSNSYVYAPQKLIFLAPRIFVKTNLWEIDYEP